MVHTEKRILSKELVIETEEMVGLLKGLTAEEKERFYFMLKGVELVHNSQVNS